MSVVSHGLVDSNTPGRSLGGSGSSGGGRVTELDVVAGSRGRSDVGSRSGVVRLRLLVDLTEEGEGTRESARKDERTRVGKRKRRG